MPSTRLANTRRDAVVTQEGDALNGGSINFRSGAQPTNVADAAQGVSLAVLSFAATAFGAPSTGSRTANAIDPATILASETVGHARILTDDPVIHSDADAGEAADSAAFTFDNKVLVEDGELEITNLNLTCPIGT